MARGAPEYDEIELRIGRGPDDAYVVHATTEEGAAEGPFELPFSRDRIDYLVLKAAMPRRGVRRMESSALREVTELGGGLFEALFRDDVRDLFRMALANADHNDKGLRIKLSLTAVPELTGLPWEFLYEEPGFLAISRLTPIVRYLDLARPRRARDVELPLRILAVVSNPTNATQLEVEKERANLEQALGDLVAQGAVEIRWLERAMLTALLEELRVSTFHILHYIGHSAYRPEVQDGVLLLEDEDDRGHEVSSRRLGAILHDHDSLRLAVLNSCEGARSSEEDPFSGVAATLIQQGIPAVIAMQFEITDRAAIVFAQHLYDGLAHGLPIDTALTESRKAIWADDNDVEWGTPVLFMRVRDGRLFSTPTPQSASGTAVPPSTPRSTAREWVAKQWVRLRWPWVLAGVGTLCLVVAALGIAVVLSRGGPSAGEWVALPGLPVALEGAAVGAYDGRVWVVGGISAGEGRPILDRVDIYDPGTRSWRSGPSLPVPLYYAALASTGSQLYLVGGLGTGGAVDTVYRLDSATSTWQVVGRLPRHAAPAPPPGTVTGSCSAAGSVPTIVRPTRCGRSRGAAGNRWDGCVPAREKLASATDGNGTVWFLAGRDPNAEENAVPAVDVAKAETVSPAGRVSAVQGPAAVWWPSQGVCMIGGQGTAGFSGSVECLDQRAKIPALSVPRAGLGATVVGSTVFVAGGYDAGHHGLRTVEGFEVATPGD